ncbi:5-formyltetrahydrofolate cyclo-ligase [Piscinibacter sp. Jin2]|uniref:5-formyltetrahydrofolate cyclo-ligase n=1 Tax=Aquariibacter lacus TaxID=2801332 RepID=A0A9X0XC54_9BURK|nr:5-formyltetrahydrofolate cyclo-ligase [Piscinibacter lacus]MBL0718824.1 5-formyltetrahydrofolate cyclo-ligase [Piscinibacter lacus]
MPPLPFDPLSLPRDKKQLRRLLQAERQALPDRLERAVQLQSVLRIWLAGRQDHTLGAYWPIKGEFDPLPALHRWTEGSGHGTGDGPPRRIGLPVMNRETKQLRFLQWYPGCPMEHDAYDIPKPQGTDLVTPTLLLVPCVGHGPGGLRLGYGGGFYDRTLAALNPRPYTVGIGYAHGHIPWLEAEPHDIPLDTLLTEEGVVWQRDGR